MKMSIDEFDELVQQAIAAIAPAFRGYLDDVPVIVDDRPDDAVCRQMGAGARRNLLGLFRGVPLNRRSVLAETGPNQIVLYRRNLLAICDSKKELTRHIGHTLIHELGHYVGFSEAQLRRYLR